MTLIVYGNVIADFRRLVVSFDYMYFNRIYEGCSK